MMSGPPPKEPKGGVPVVTWAEAIPGARAMRTNGRRTRRAWIIGPPVFSRRGERTMLCSLQRERAGREAGVEGDRLELEVEDQAVVEKFLDVERHLCAVDGAVVGEADLDRDVKEFVVVGMNVEGQGYGEEGGGVEVKINLAKMLKQGRDIGCVCGLLGDGKMLDRERIPSFLADVGG